MKLQAEHLMTFAKVADTGSVSAAALELHRSQPAVSLQLKALSEVVGETLYTRHRHGVTLTAAGKALLPHARALTRSLKSAEATLHDLQNVARGELRISASMTVAVYLLPKLLADFRTRYPGLELTLLTRNSQEVTELLHAGNADLGFIEGSSQHVDNLVSEAFFDDEIVLVTPPDSVLAQRAASGKALEVKDLQGLELVRREEGSGTREVVTKMLSDIGLNTRTVLEATGLEAVKEGALQGIGAAFLSGLAVKRELRNGLLVVVPIRGVRLERRLTLLHPELNLCSRATTAFLDFVLKSS